MMVPPSWRLAFRAAAVFLRFERHRRRLFVNLVVNRHVGGRKVRQTRLGSLCSVVWTEPISVAER